MKDFLFVLKVMLPMYLYILFLALPPLGSK